MEKQSWTSLPDHIVISIMTHLSYRDRSNVGLTCKTWHKCFISPYLWHDFRFTFLVPKDSKMLQCAKQYAKHFRCVTILLDQHETSNRENACKVLHTLSDTDHLRLSSLRIRFMGENPLFYAGYEFVDELKSLFARKVDSRLGQLRHVDLSGLAVAFDGAVIDLLSSNNPDLESLNLLNQILVCKVPPDCILRLAERCRKLKDLRLYHSSMTDDVLRAFSQPERMPLKHLGILCRREQKYIQDLSSEAWTELSKACPELKVVIGFDHTCPLLKVSNIMKPEIPVTELRLETYTYIFDEVNQAASFYKKTLEKVVLQTRNSKELGESLINLCQKCAKLTALYVYCVLEKSVVDTILGLCPLMKEKGTYVLKWEEEYEPFVVGLEGGD